MRPAANEAVGKLILRLALGVIVLLHGVAKLRGGIDGIEQLVVAHGLPAFVAYGAYVGEVLAPALLILGFYARVGAVLIAVNMLVAIFLAHSAEIFTLGPQGGWALELQGMLLFAAIASALLGPGRPAINDR